MRIKDIPPGPPGTVAWVTGPGEVWYVPVRWLAPGTTKSELYYAARPQADTAEADVPVVVERKEPCA
jgi:hypothetical protein